MKTKMNNKMLKVSLLVAIFATIQVPALFAQESSASSSEVTFVYESGAPMEIGDSVMINKDSLRYLTGERMSTWVYGVPHQIRQLGTKTRPAGVLLRGIYSWIAKGSLIPLNVEKTTETIERKKAEAAAAAAAIAAAEAAEEAARLKMLEELVEEEEEVVEVVEDTLPPAPQPYQINRFTVGVRGGLASLMPQTTPAIGATWGFDALLDLQYAHYWAKGEDKIRLGLLTGVSVGYMQNQKPIEKQLTENFTYSVEGVAETEYTTTIDKAKVLNRQLQLEVPVMFSMITPKGFFLNAGPKFILPVYASFNQTLKNGDISALLVDMDVTATENVVTGEIKEAEFVHTGVNNHQLDLTIAVGGELGYEHQLESGHSVSVGLYANYGVFSTYKHDLETSKYIVDVNPPTVDGVFQLAPNSMMNAYANKLGFLDLGLKVAFHLNWKK